MTHDKYDNDILKQLSRIANSLEKIEKNTERPRCNITKISDDKYYIQSEGQIVDPEKTLYEQFLPCCLECEHYYERDKHCLNRGRDIDCAANTCCTEYRRNRK